MAPFGKVLSDEEYECLVRRLKEEEYKRFTFRRLAIRLPSGHTVVVRGRDISQPFSQCSVACPQRSPPLGCDLFNREVGCDRERLPECMEATGGVESL
jgi:hypothetical protein